MDKPIAAAKDLQRARRDFQIVYLGPVLFQHLQITVLRGHAAGAPGVVVVGHDGEQCPHQTVLGGTAAFAFRLDGHSQMQGLATGVNVRSSGRAGEDASI